MGTLREDVRTCMIVSSCIPFTRMRNDSDKAYSEYQNIHLMFSMCLTKMVPFVR